MSAVLAGGRFLFPRLLRAVGHADYITSGRITGHQGILRVRWDGHGRSGGSILRRAAG
jgi:hypothetical protein